MIFSKPTGFLLVNEVICKISRLLFNELDGGDGAIAPILRGNIAAGAMPTAASYAHPNFSSKNSSPTSLKKSPLLKQKIFIKKIHIKDIH